MTRKKELVILDDLKIPRLKTELLVEEIEKIDGVLTDDEINQINILQRTIHRAKNEIIKSLEQNYDIANFSNYMRKRHDEIIRCQAIIDYIKTKKVRKHGDI